MNLSKKECIEVSEVTFHNSEVIYNDAIALANNKSYGRATSLLILSMEENMKGLILFLDGNGFEFRKRVKGIKNLFINHKLRYPIAFFVSCLNILKKDVEKYFFRISRRPVISRYLIENEEVFEKYSLEYLRKKLKQISTEVNWFLKAEFLRQEGIYVDFDNVLKTPLDIKEKDFNDVLLRIKALKDFTSYFTSWFYEKDDSGEYLHERYLPPLKKMLVEKKVYTLLGEFFSDSKKRPLEPLLIEVLDFEEDIQE